LPDPDRKQTPFKLPSGLLYLLAAMAACVGLIAGLWTLRGMFDALERLVDPAVQNRVPPSEALRNLSFLLAAIVGAGFAIWRGWIAQRQAEAAAEQVKIATNNNRTARLTEAVNQLGADKTVKVVVDGPDGAKITEERTEPNLEVRLGGLYALERLSKDSEEDHITVMEILCAYIRENAKGSDLPPLVEDLEPPKDDADRVVREAHFEALEERLENIREAAGSLAAPRVEIQAALTILGRRSDALRAFERGKEYSLDLRESDLRKADLAGAQLEHARLTGARMEGAILVNAQMEFADLREARMEGANLFAAQMEGANLSRARLERAYLRRARIEGASLSGARMEGAYLGEAREEGTVLGGARLVAPHGEIDPEFLVNALGEGC